MMLKVIDVKTLNQQVLQCTFNNGISKQLDIKPLIENHKHINGVEQLNDDVLFSKVRIGSMGEIVWDGIVQIDGQVWDYDISPEFAFENAV